MDAVKKFWLAGNIDATLKEIRQVLGRKDGPTPETDTLLLFAYIYYQLGNVHCAAELLNKIQFDVFDVKQWIVENNILVIKYLENKSLEDKKSVASSFRSLHEKIGGLPYSNVQLLEPNVCFNYALVIFCSNTQRVLVPGGYNVSQAALLKTLERVCEKRNETHQRLNRSIGEKLGIYFNNAQEQKQELVTWLVWLLASNLLINFQVTEAQNVLDIVLDFYKPNRLIGDKMNLIFTLVADTNNHSQDFLRAACHLMRSYSCFLLKKKILSMKHCDLCLSLQPKFVSGLFLKGLLLHESGKYEDGIQYLQQVVTLSNDNGYKATALNLLGCICAKLGKPHTALLKFRESFASDAGHLEALYNVAVVYHDNGDLDLEISMWKYILKILSFQRACPTVVKINIDYICGITAQALGDSISEGHFMISTDIHCVRGCEVKNPKLGLPSVFFKIAHNCFILKRYSEASEFYGQLLAQLNENPISLQECGITSLPTVYKEFSEALLKCGRCDDCLVVCEKILNQETPSNTLSKAISLQDGTRLIEIMLCKAAVLAELQRPVEANESYERILDVINKSYNESCTIETDSGEPEQKRQKRVEGPAEHRCKPREDLEEVRKLKALTLNNQSMLVSSFGRKKEALLMLTQSISCQPDCLKYRYNHTKMLFDMGMEDEAARDWLKFRIVDDQTSSTNNTDFTKCKNFKLKDLSCGEDRDFCVEMDSRAILRLSK